MKKFFSLFILVALFATVMLLAACEETYVPGDGPEDAVVCEHKFVDKKVEPTCVKDGYTEHTCSECGYYYRDDIKDSGHTIPKDKYRYVVTYPYGDGEPGGDVGCTTVKTKMRYCTKCDWAEAVEGADPVITDSHYKSGKINTDMMVLVESSGSPTCTEAGTQTWGCIYCGFKDETVDVPALGHVWGEWIVDREPSCSANYVVFGTQHRTCSACSLTEMDTILPHSCDCEGTDTSCDFAVTPDCEHGTIGYRTHTCKDCGVEYNRDFVEPEHQYSDWKTVEGYTGLVVRECTECGHKEYKELK